MIDSTMNSSSSKAVEKRLKKADVRVVWKEEEERNEKEGEKNSVRAKQCKHADSATQPSLGTSEQNVPVARDT